jgi:hypothetical protein
MARSERWFLVSTIMGVVGSVITIFVFITGVNSLREVAARYASSKGQQPVSSAPTAAASALQPSEPASQPSTRTSTSESPAPTASAPVRPAIELASQPSTRTPTPDLGARDASDQSTGYSFPAVPPSEGDPGRTSRLEIVRAELNGRSMEPSDPVIDVGPGQAIEGQVELRAYSTWKEAAIAFGMTASWDRHSTSVVDYGGFFSPVNGLRRDVRVDLRAPSKPGEYYIIFAFRGEFTAAQVFSATNWTVGNPKWDNGDDIADWPRSMVWQAIRDGRVAAAYAAPEDSAFYVPACAIVVRVHPRPMLP